MAAIQCFEFYYFSDFLGLFLIGKQRKRLHENDCPWASNALMPLTVVGVLPVMCIVHDALTSFSIV